MADGAGFKPVINELVSDLVKPVVDEFGKVAETAANSTIGVKVNPTQSKPSDNQQGNQTISSDEIQKNKQAEEQRILFLRRSMEQRAKLDEDMRQIRLKKKQEEEEKKKAGSAEKQGQQQKEILQQQEAQDLNPQVKTEMTKSETRSGKGVSG